jgi:rubredoxin
MADRAQVVGFVKASSIGVVVTMKTYMCVICGFIYDEEQGYPEEGIAPGTKWEDVPMNWKCPECGAGKEDFEMVEV